MSAVGAHLPALALAWSGVALGLVSPGPSQMAVMGTALARGRAAAVALALGVATGTAGWAAASALGLAQLLSASTPAMATLRLGAAAYLAFLAWRAFAAARAPAPAPLAVRGARGAGALWLRGLALQATNLKAGLYWTALAALGVGAQMGGAAALLLVGGCAAISAAVHATYAAAFSRPGAARAYERARPWVQSGLCAFFGAASLALLAGRP